MALQNLKPVQKALSMQESLLKNKKVILKTKLSTLKKDIQISKLSQILEAELTSKDRVLEEYWNPYSKAISKKLWLPQVIDFQDSAETYLNGYSNSSAQNLQSSIQKHLNPIMKSSQTILWKLSQSLPPDTTVKESIVTERTRFYPNKVQRALLEKCFAVHRYFYNKGVEFVKDPTNKGVSKSAITIRKNVKIKNDDLEHAWMKEVPFDTRYEPIRKVAVSYKTGMEGLKKGRFTKFDMRFVSKKDTNVCYINPNALSKDFRLFTQKLKKDAKIKTRRKQTTDTKPSAGIFPIIKESGKYFMCLVKEVSRKSTNIEHKDNIVALDPGVRCFQTYYSQQECGTIGEQMNGKIRNINKKLDKLEKLYSKSKSKTKYAMKRRCMLLRSKITNMVTDMHWKTALFLTRRYKVILLPTFGVKNMSMKNPNKKTNREMYNLAHYRFKLRLKQKALENNCTVIDCCESYTTKTCSSCGVCNENVGSKKIFTCICSAKPLNRDLNGSRNIFIRCLTKYYSGLDTIRQKGG